VVYMNPRLYQDISGLRMNIVKDLQARDFGKDPFGYCNYLLFLLDISFEHDAFDNLVDWMNAFIRDVVNERKLSRSADTEITTAIFGYYILSKYHRLTTDIDVNKINDLIEGHIDNKGLYFKGNLTYTIILLLSLFKQKEEISNWDKARDALRGEYQNRNLQCDPKNICYYSLLLEIERNSDELKELSKMLLNTLTRNDTNTHDKPYYLWTAWRNRKYIRKSLDLVKKTIVNSYENFAVQIEIGNEPQSKIIKSIYYNLIKSFVGKTLLVSYDEYHKPNTFAKLGGFVWGLLVFLAGLVFLFYSYRFGVLSRLNLRLVFDSKNLMTAGVYLLLLIVSMCILLLVIYIVYLGLLVIWEVSIKNRYVMAELCQRLNERSKDFVNKIWRVILLQVIFAILQSVR